MIDFTVYPIHDPYRTLSDITPDLPALVGPDVYALQCAINEVLDLDGGAELVTDGELRSKTGEMIWRVQKKLGVTEDGLAGQETMTAAVLYLLGRIVKPWRTRYLLVQGILLKESGCWRLGDYSGQRPPRPGVTPTVDGGDYDAGITQQNTEHHDPAEAFNPVLAIPKLTAYVVEGLRLYNDRKLYVGDDHSRRRRLSLAAGRWNAPYWANHLAGVKPDAVPNDAQRAVLETYMAIATKLIDQR